MAQSRGDGIEKHPLDTLETSSGWFKVESGCGGLLAQDSIPSPLFASCPSLKWSVRVIVTDMTEVWFRDPIYYIKECAELAVPNIIWNNGVLAKRNIDSQRWMELHYPSVVDYRILVTTDGGTQELRFGYSPVNPYACYPTWRYGEQTLDDLREYIQNPVGENKALCTDLQLDPKERPIWGQEHRVLIDRWPDGYSSVGRAFLKTLSELQEEYPEAIIHLHNACSWRYAFGMGYRASDVNPHDFAICKEIVLGSGKRVLVDQAARFMQWLALHGMTVGDLDTQQGRVKYNIKSAQWAARNWTENINFKVRGPNTQIDPTAPYHIAASTRSHMAHPMKKMPDDMIQCDTCSLTLSCKYYRDGAVCSVPKSDPVIALGSHFRSRDSYTVIDGLGRLMELEAERVVEAREAERYNDGGLDPELTKAANALFKQGAVLAKLVDPQLAAAGATRVQVNIGTQQPLTPSSMAASAIAALEAKGHKREDISLAMITEHLLQNQTRMIEAVARP